VIRQPHLEGMLPYEYSLILKALKLLQVGNINVYFEAQAVSDQSLNGQVHRVKFYHNKRFFKFTESGLDTETEIADQLNVSDDYLKTTKTLFISEGSMLPSRTEVKLAEKSKFDLYTITNFSFSDLAHHLSVPLNLFAVSKNDLSNREEEIKGFSNLELFT